MKRIQIGAFAIACVGCVIGGAIHEWNHRGPVAPDVPIVVEPVAPVQTAAPGSAHCVHEDCHERPKWLRCVEWHPGYREAALCGRFEIEYEHHCDCDRWEP